MKGVMIAVCMAAVAICSGCASIVSKSQYPVTINSNPEGATVIVKNKHGLTVQKATTPATLTLSASAGFFNPASYSFEFSKDGYSQDTTSLSARMDPWYVGNIVFGGLIGIVIVDPATGAMWKLDNTVCGNLSKNATYQASTPAAKAPSQKVSSQDSQQQAERLAKLKNLKDSGLITTEEYETKRSAIISSL